MCFSMDLVEIYRYDDISIGRYKRLGGIYLYHRCNNPMRIYYPHGIALYLWVSYHGHGYRGPMYNMQHFQYPHSDAASLAYRCGNGRLIP